MKTFLSIDIDFWNDLKPERLEADLRFIIERAKKKNLPINAVMNHQQMTPLVNESGALRLLNIDTHSDLASFDVRSFNCGTWVSYVKWRKKGTYAWYHRLSVSHGECSVYPIFRRDGVNHKFVDWKSVDRQQVKRLPKLNFLFNECVGVCLCMSPAYSDWQFRDVFRNLVKEYGIPYKRGREDEDYYCVSRRPPYKTNRPIPE